ncbi:COBW domain-containing protein 2 [Chlorella vulgaris]
MQMSTTPLLKSVRPARLRVSGRSVCCLTAATRQPQARGATSLRSLPPPTTATAPRQRLARRCAAAANDSDVIDVEGKVVDDRVPVTIITGFLGSGKTTLLNQILKGDHGHRIAVIENEFGAIDIDSDLVAVEESLDPKAEQIMMLNNGCLCCTVRDDLVKMLGTLYDRRSQFDRIVIETTGLAQPAPIIQTFFLEPSVSDRMRLDGVVTLVDAKHVELHLDEQKPEGVVNEALEQIAYADRVVLNKTDLVEPADLERLEERIRSINSMAEVRRAQRAQVPLDYVLGVGGFELERVEEQVMAESAHRHEHDHKHDHDHTGSDCTHESHKHESHSHSHDHGHSHASSSAGDKDTEEHDCAGAGCGHESHSHGHGHAHHVHDDAVGSVNYWLGGLIEVQSNDLYRMKGVLAIKDFDKRFVFQGVHMLFEGMPDRPWKEGEKRVSKMVFIGKELDKALIEEGFAECVVKKQ